MVVGVVCVTLDDIGEHTAKLLVGQLTCKLGFHWLPQLVTGV